VQGEHVADEGGLDVPASQFEQMAEPAALKVPALQPRHDVAPVPG
jgi:hypothetical protein